MPGTVLESVNSSEHYLQIPPLRGINTLLPFSHSTVNSSLGLGSLFIWKTEIQVMQPVSPSPVCSPQSSQTDLLNNANHSLLKILQWFLITHKNEIQIPYHGQQGLEGSGLL